MKSNRKLGAAAVIVPMLSLAALISPHAAGAEDVAIVTGIGEYGNLPSASLPGIDNDVAAMQGVLQGKFRVIKLWNGQATEAGIRSAFQQAARLVGPTDRFVYYQSSHGTEENRLLTYDTTTSGEHTLGAQDLKSLMAQIHSTRKSLILDACYSGGIKSRGAGARVKFFPIRRFKDFSRNRIHDRLDEVVRVYNGPAANPSQPDTDNPFVIFASSQANEYSEVVRIQGEPCSVFTHFFVEALNSAGVKGRAGVRNAIQSSRARKGADGPAWNVVVQPTVRATVDFTEGKQTPVFNPRYLSNIVFTTSDGGGGGAASTSVSNLGQLYDTSNDRPDALALSATTSNDADEYGRFRPGTKVNLKLDVGQRGYLFVINRDDEDNAQMVSLTERDLDFNNADSMLDQSMIDGERSIDLSKLYNITTSRRDGEERWKAFLFTNKDQARDFAQAWCALTRDKGKKVRRGSFKGTKLAHIERIGLDGADSQLYTSELHYRVTTQGSN